MKMPMENHAARLIGDETGIMIDCLVIQKHQKQG